MDKDLFIPTGYSVDIQVYPFVNESVIAGYFSLPNHHHSIR